MQSVLKDSVVCTVQSGPDITASYRPVHVQLIISSLGAVVDTNRAEHSKIFKLSPLILHVTYFHVPYDRPVFEQNWHTPTYFLLPEIQYLKEMLC